MLNSEAQSIQPERVPSGREQLEADLEVCRDVLRQSQSSFRFAFFLLPRDERDALSAVYAFCRAADDIADEAGATSPGDRLDAWRREIDRAFAGRPAHAIGRALSWAIDTFALPRDPFDDLIDGVVTDLTVDRYSTSADLEKYCYQVASTVGLLCVRIFGVPAGVADEYAVELGKAFQLTNILRDIGEDAGRGRIYLPLEDLALVGCTEASILEGRQTPELGRLIDLEVARARWLYARAEALMPADAEMRRRLKPAEAMRAVYAALLDRVELAGAAVLDHPVRVSKIGRAWRAAWTWLGPVA